MPKKFKKTWRDNKNKKILSQTEYNTPDETKKKHKTTSLNNIHANK